MKTLCMLLMATSLVACGIDAPTQVRHAEMTTPAPSGGVPGLSEGGMDPLPPFPIPLKETTGLRGTVLVLDCAPGTDPSKCPAEPIQAVIFITTTDGEFVAKGETSPETGTFSTLAAAGKYVVTAHVSDPKLTPPSPAVVKVIEGSMTSVRLVFETAH